MRAARFHTFGGPEVLQLDEVAWPHPADDQVLIRVHASSINGTDLGLRRGEGPVRFSVRRPFTVGLDVAGEVVRVGRKVSAFEVGQRVYSLLGHSGGGAAEYVNAKASRVALAPDNVGWAEAAAVPLAGLTALQALREGAGDSLRPGARVLVYGASGGIGAFGVQLAQHFGAVVTGVARKEKLDFVRNLGANAVLDTENLASAWQDGPWDVVFDTPPALKFAEVKPHLGKSGVYVSTRPIPTSPGDVGGMLARSGPRFASVMTKERSQDLTYLARLIDDGVLRVPLDRTFPLSEIVAAHQYAEGPTVRGKVVVRI